MPQDLFEDVLTALDERSAIYENYIAVLDAQRVAARSGDLALMSNLSSRVDGLISDLQTNWGRIAPAGRFLGDAALNGKRTQTVRDRLTVISAKAALAQSGIREITARLCAQRDAVAGQIEAEFGSSGTGHPSYPSGPNPFPVTSLIDASG